MVEILNGELIREDVTKNAMGGTELIASEMVKRLDKDLLSKFQIIHSRVRNLDPNKKRILVCHDLVGDPECDHLKNGGYNNFDKIVFVSNWQMQKFIDFYSIPWYKCIVLQNAINPLEKSTYDGGKIKLIYHTTPHRGLDILVSAFDSLIKKHDDIELDVYSSFKIYGWEHRDEQYKDLFDFCRNHEKINYHGSVSNDEVRDAVSKANIFAYPSIWQETSCISLIEAMSAGLLCVHSNYGALYETASNWTYMYQYQNNPRDHLRIFHSKLDYAIDLYRTGLLSNNLNNQKKHTDTLYNWDLRTDQWNNLLKSLL
jgi:UDP-glucose:(glucosyl)LPS alpha-1,2-glucosyltransferase